MNWKLILLFLGVVGVFTNCQKEELGIEGVWNLIKRSGGPNPVNCDYDRGRILWTFANNNIAIVDNFDTIGGTFCIGSINGNYSYSTIEVDGQLLLMLSGQEFGEITLQGDEMSIKQKVSSNGDGGVLLQFEK